MDEARSSDADIRHAGLIRDEARQGLIQLGAISRCPPRSVLGTEMEAARPSSHPDLPGSGMAIDDEFGAIFELHFQNAPRFLFQIEIHATGFQPGFNADQFRLCKGVEYGFVHDGMSFC